MNCQHHCCVMHSCQRGFRCWALSMFCLPLPSWHVGKGGGGKRGEEGAREEGGGISAASLPSVFFRQQQTQDLIERKAYRAETHLHLLVLLGQCQHLSALSLHPDPGVQACLCPARRHQRMDSTVSDGGTWTSRPFVLLLYHDVYVFAFTAMTFILFAHIIKQLTKIIIKAVCAQINYCNFPRQI